MLFALKVDYLFIFRVNVSLEYVILLIKKLTPLFMVALHINCYMISNFENLLEYLLIHANMVLNCD